MTKKLMMAVATLAMAFGAWAESYMWDEISGFGCDVVGNYSWEYLIYDGGAAIFPPQVFHNEMRVFCDPNFPGNPSESAYVAVFGRLGRFVTPIYEPFSFYQGEITIPSKLGGVPVTCLGPYCFSALNSPGGGGGIGGWKYDFDVMDGSYMTKVTIPHSVTNIGKFAFQNCSGLTSLTIPAGVTGIGTNAFAGCSGLRSLEIMFRMDFTVGELFGRYHEFNDKLAGRYDSWRECYYSIRESAIEIYRRYHSNIDGLKVLQYETGVEHGRSAVYYCIPAGLEKVVLYCDAVVGMFENCTMIKTIELKCGVTNIGNYACCGCTNLSVVTFPDGVRRIGDHSFENCIHLQKTEFPSSTTNIGLHAFSDCLGLTSVKIPNSVKSIGVGAFDGCSNVMHVTIPQIVSTNNLARIFSSACESLEELAFADGVTAIGERMCGGYTNLTTVVIPESVTEIATNAFVTCSNLVDVTMPWMPGMKLSKIFPDSHRKIKAITLTGETGKVPEEAFMGCENLEKIVIPESVTEIATNAFVSCSNLVDVTMPWMPGMKLSQLFPDSYKKIKKLTLTGSIDHIPAGAFKGCASLERVDIPKAVKRVGASAFEGCASLTGLKLPDGVGEVGALAFKGCKALKTPVELPNSVTNLGASAFADCTGLESVGWNWWPWRLKEIPSSLFKGCTNLERVDGISSSIGRIGASAFEDCENLSSILLPSSVTNMGAKVFQGCSGLTSAQLPSNLKSIPDYTFNGCGWLMSVKMPSKLTSIGKAAFFGCLHKTAIDIPETVTKIGEQAFGDCWVLSSLDIPEGVTVLPAWMCGGCGALSRISIPSGVAKVSDYAFAGCTNLTSVALPGSVTDIGTNAFARCVNLKTILLDDRTNAVSVASNSVPVSTAVKVLARNGYSFAGWTDETDTPLSDPFHMGEDITAFPMWLVTGDGSAPLPEPTPEPVVEPGLYEEAEGAAPLAAASEYNGYLYDSAGKVAGTIQVKVGKPNARTGLAGVKATVVADAAKKSLKADGGKAVIAKDGPTMIQLVGGEPCEVTLGAEGLLGSYGPYLIDGARNFFTSKDKSEQSVANDILAPWLGAVVAVWDGGNASVSIGMRGKAKATVTLADGTKATANAQLLIGENWMCVPVVVTKKMNLAFTLWLPRNGGAAIVKGLTGDAVVGKSGALKSGAKFRIDAEAFSERWGQRALPYLPDGMSVESGARWTVAGGARAGKVAYRRGTTEIDVSKLGENPSALKLTYTARTGSFKGSFKVYADNGGRLKATKVDVSGVVVDGVAYGTATIRGVGAVPVRIE